ncbi:MAG: YolD-like family protein [Clostridia bacterium]|nr:YolD-like family protein [Clostridia bacterium]MCI8979863.1 YolD-like family protein [Clostridia bacterium]
MNTDNQFNNSDKYNDIINLPHHQSKTHPHMSLLDRAAQFSPFAALPCYGDAVKETARITDTKIELDESEKTIINEKLLMIAEYLDNKPSVSITYFMPDIKKTGGKYLTITGTVKKFDEYNNHIKMTDGTIVIFDDIIAVESDLFTSIF